jgi:hypothetical protein
MDLRDAPLFVDDVCDSPRVLVLRRLSRAVSQADFVVGVAQKRKLETVFLREFLVRFDAVEAGTEDLDVLLRVIVGEVPEPGTFGRSAGCVGLRKEPQHDFLSAKVAELDATSEMIGSFEVRSSIADFQHRWTSPHTLQ